MGRKKLYYPGMKSKAYWAQRMLDRDKKAKKSEDKILKEIEKIYRKVFREITKELNTFYVNYATEKGITMGEAKKILTPVEYMNLKETIEDLKASLALGSKEALEELELLSARRKVTRYQALIDSIDTYLIEATNNVQITIEEHLSKMYTRSYRDSLKDVGANNTQVINHRAVKEVIAYPWSGRMFSERIWENKKSLIDWIKKDLSAGIIRGDSIQRMARDLSNKEKATNYQAERLVRTETNRCMTKGHIDGYIDSNLVYGVEVLVAGDERTCGNCIDHEGEVIKLSEASSGANIPPFHPNCRCSVIPILKDEV